MKTNTLIRLMGILAAAGVLFAQQPPKKKVEGARDLFYFGATQKDTLPPIQKTSAPKPPRSGTTATQTASTPAAKTPALPVAAAPAADTSTLHLGFRYTVQLVNQTTGKSEAVDPDRDFKKGECVRMEVESNQSGYLYVLSKQSSGGWLPLFPSSEMPDETNVADPGVKVRAPKEYCFEIDNPAGTETLFVVLSRSPRDFFELYDAIKAPAATSPGNNAKAPASAIQMADAGKMNSAVEKMAKNFGTRDLVIKKVTPAPETKDADYSVYVVNGSDKPSSTVVKKVEIKHK